MSTIGWLRYARDTALWISVPSRDAEAGIILRGRNLLRPYVPALLLQMRPAGSSRPGPAVIIDGRAHRCQGPIPEENRPTAGVDPASLFR